MARVGGDVGALGAGSRSRRSKATRPPQATTPKAIRDVLGPRVGDKTSFNESTDGTDTMRNANAQALESPLARTPSRSSGNPLPTSSW